MRQKYCVICGYTKPTATKNKCMKNINQIVECLQNGGVALLPTDTIYGLAASPKFPEAVDKIYSLKSRPKDWFLPIMVANMQQLEDLNIEINDNVHKLLNSEFVPGALSLVLGFKNSKRPEWLQGREEIAVRIPDDKTFLGVLEQTGALLVTSANKHGNPNTQNSVDEILDELNGTPDIVIDKGIKNEIPSTIINCRNNPPTVEREGCISVQTLQQIVQLTATA